MMKINRSFQELWGNTNEVVLRYKTTGCLTLTLHYLQFVAEVSSAALEFPFHELPTLRAPKESIHNRRLAQKDQITQNTVREGQTPPESKD